MYIEGNILYFVAITAKYFRSWKSLYYLEDIDQFSKILAKKYGVWSFILRLLSILPSTLILCHENSISKLGF